MRSCFYRLFLREEEYSPEYFRKLMKIRASNASDGWLENGGILKALIKRRDYVSRYLIPKKLTRP